ncbi:MAG: hypothetical protein INR70_17435 [Parafilimonas terrae]|nr:hypothetical protein [Parafilimonas terrae]
MYKPIEAPPGLVLPGAVTGRSQIIPARGYFAEHALRWRQRVNATSGVPSVVVEGRSFVIPPEQAVWLPAGVRHRVGSLLGSQFRSLRVADEVGQDATGTGRKPPVRFGAG